MCRSHRWNGVECLVLGWDESGEVGVGNGTSNARNAIAWRQEAARRKQPAELSTPPQLQPLLCVPGGQLAVPKRKADPKDGLHATGPSSGTARWGGSPRGIKNSGEQRRAEG